MTAAAAIPVRRSSALEPDRGAFTILREVAHACARSLHPNYASQALGLQQKHGLSVATGHRLRQLFGVGNVSACRLALEPWSSSSSSSSNGAASRRRAE